MFNIYNNGDRNFVTFQSNFALEQGVFGVNGNSLLVVNISNFYSNSANKNSIGLMT